jgi:HSP20 family protein
MTNESNITRTERGEKQTRNLQGRGIVAPLCDIYENADEYLLVADLPGTTEDKVSLHVERGELYIEGVRDIVEQGKVLGREWRPLDYRRNFALPDDCNSEAISANLKLGVLSVHIPKTASARPHKITVQTGS